MGNFSRGRENGLGTILYANKVIDEGHWKDGLRVSSDESSEMDLLSP